MSDNKIVVGGINFGPGPGSLPQEVVLRPGEEREATPAEVRELAERTGHEEPPDRLEEIFRRQRTLMDKLVMADKLPEYPIDITQKYGQRQIKELTFAMIEEMTEGTYILKNRSHRFTDHTDVDFEHFREELGDALAYFIEICVFAGISPQELFDEYCRKNAVVQKRIRDGY